MKTGGTIALVMAAGRGSRLGGGLPKQYRTLAGRPLLRRTVDSFARHDAIDSIAVVINPDDRIYYDEATAGLDLLEPLPGGTERQESVRLGLESLKDRRPDRVLIHDGARPFVGQALISRVLEGLNHHPAALPALPLTDSLKRAAEGLCRESLSRDGLYRAQTPQGFHYQAILEAHRAFAGARMTDDAGVAAAAGLQVALVEGEEDNMKITSQGDIERAERLLRASSEIRSGQGFDVHRLEPGTGLRLCGLDIPCDLGLIGHSDADVGLHAVVDAILGALAEGDIGSHFPPSDPQWRGADSAQFVAAAAARLQQRGARLLHLDLTVICERPKIGPRRDEMRQRIADLLGVAVERISIKATTTERLGFTGRGEGIAVQALATIETPTRGHE